MTFGEAIEKVKAGSRICRRGWNGKGQYVELATCISYKNADGEIVNCEHESIGNKALAFVGTSGVQMGWLASQSDMLADDWEELEAEKKSIDEQAKSIADAFTFYLSNSAGALWIDIPKKWLARAISIIEELIDERKRD